MSISVKKDCMTCIKRDMDPGSYFQQVGNCKGWDYLGECNYEYMPRQQPKPYCPYCGSEDIDYYETGSSEMKTCARCNMSL